MKRVLLIAAAAAVLGACASQPYGTPVSPLTETRISSDRARITYRGTRGEDPWRVSDQALLRAADLAVQDGFTWFLVDQRYSEDRGGGRSSGPFISVGGGSSSWGRRSSTSLGGAIGFSLGGGQSSPAVTETIEVRFGHGAKPEGAYDAADLQRTIRGRLAY